MASLSPVDSVTFAGISADQAVGPPLSAHKGLRFCGFSARESDGTPAVAAFNICNGAVANADFLAVVELAANTSTAFWCGDPGVAAPDGISVDRVAGTVDVVVYFRHEHVPNP